MDNFALLVKTELLKRGLTQRDIAKQLKLSDSAISMYIDGKSKSERFNTWVQRNLGICLKSHKGFTLMEMMISMVVISILMAASMPMISQFSTFKTGVDKNVIKCITASSSTGWYDTDGAGATALPTTEPCRAAVVDTQYNRGRALSTTEWYAKNGNSSQEGMAKKILRTACDLGGEKACDYFINKCWTDGSTSGTRCDDISGFTDISYYLHQHRTTNTNNGATYIYNQLETLLPKMMPNLVAEVFYSSGTNQAPDANQNLNENLAFELAKPRIYIQACNNGFNDACIESYNNNWNRSCSRVKTNWSNAPSGNYRLTYNASGNYETVNCNMTNFASAAISGCTNIAANLFNNNPPNDDCTVGWTNFYNRNCTQIAGSWPEAADGTFNLTTNGAPATVPVSAACIIMPPAACIAAGPGTLCADGTKYAGAYAGYYYFTSPSDETGTYTWNNGTGYTDYGGYTNTGAVNTNDGMVNYNILATSADGGSPYYANNICKGLNTTNSLGHNDWFLPSINEFSNLLGGTNCSLLGLAWWNYYWTSTEYSRTNAWRYQTSDCGTGSGYNSAGGKIGSYPVRCIRRSAVQDASCTSVGNVCADGSKYAGAYLGNYYYLGSGGSATWNNGIGYPAGGNGGYIVVGGTTANNGAGNTAILTASANAGSPYQAALACKARNDSNYLGHTDWFLPASLELQGVLCINRAVIGGIVNDSGYWSSKEDSAEYASRVYMNGSCSIYSNDTGKAGALRVRCVRKTNSP